MRHSILSAITNAFVSVKKRGFDLSFGHTFDAANLPGRCSSAPPMLCGFFRALPAPFVLVLRPSSQTPVHLC
jgi:hypothetical protein